jgi:hypothetical protein
MKKFFFILLFSSCISLYSAACGTHLYFVELWMEKKGGFDLRERNALIAGTLFPDIRYLGTVSRNKTHERRVTVKKINDSRTFFQKGMRLHVFLDERRNLIVKKWKILEKLVDIEGPKREFFLKLVEDEILWDQIHPEWAIEALKEPYREACLQIGSLQTVQAWNLSLQDYFGNRPSVFLKELSDQGKGFASQDVETVAKWAPLVASYAKNKDFINYTQAMIFSVLDQALNDPF